MIEAVIFDMDGILVDSEPFWQEAEMEVFAKVGIHLTRDQCMETTGLPVNDVVQFRYTQQPWKNKSLAQVSDEILKGVETRVRASAVLLDGVSEAIEFFKRRRVAFALASSSAMQLIQTVLEKVCLKDVFNIIHSAENEDFGKPHPAVFLTTAKRLQIAPMHCVVIEDSFNGLIAAKAARMKTIVVPAKKEWSVTKFDIADLKLKSLQELSEHHWNILQSV